MNRTTLYKKNKSGKIQVYQSYTEGDTLFSRFGEQGGKIQTSSIICKPKNVGRSNETTGAEQALKESLSKCQLKRDKGYFDTVEEAHIETVFLPMLAKDGHKVRIKYPCDAQPKLDGVRCMAPKKALMSRGGKPYIVPHISKALPLEWIPNMVLDGELYIHGDRLQTIVSLVKKNKPGSENIEYWIYDLYLPNTPNADWRERKRHLKSIKEHFSLDSPIKIVPTYRVNNKEEMFALHNKFVAQGFEGIILRTDDGVYELGHRSSSLIKYKHFFDAEYKIVSYKEGIGKFVGCVIWRCITPEGHEFDVTPKGTITEKKEWYKNATAQIGKDLTVRYWNKTEKGIPSPAVGIVIRDYEN
jgi:DNA ligase-1